MITCNYGGEAALRTMHLQLETKIIWSAHLAVRRLLVDFGVTSPEKCKWLVLLGEGGRYYFASLLPSEPYCDSFRSKFTGEFLKRAGSLVEDEGRGHDDVSWLLRWVWIPSVEQAKVDDSVGFRPAHVELFGNVNPPGIHL